MHKNKVNSSFRVFSSPYTLVFSALLVAMSVSGKIFAFNIGEALRISYENLPVVLSGIVFGPLAGLLVGVMSDLCGCLAVGYAVNPIITLGCGALGFVGGIIPMFSSSRFGKMTLILSDVSAHVIGSLAIKTLGISVYYGAEKGFFILLFSRFLNYVPIMILEILILLCLFSNKYIKKELGRFSA